MFNFFKNKKDSDTVGYWREVFNSLDLTPRLRQVTNNLDISELSTKDDLVLLVEDENVHIFSNSVGDNIQSIINNKLGRDVNVRFYLDLCLCDLFGKTKATTEIKQEPKKEDNYYISCGGGSSSLINDLALVKWLDYKRVVKGYLYKSKKPANDLIKCGSHEQQMKAVNTAITSGWDGFYFKKKKITTELASYAQIKMIADLLVSKNAIMNSKDWERTITKKEAHKTIESLLSTPANLPTKKTDESFDNVFVKGAKSLSLEKKVKLFTAAREELKLKRICQLERLLSHERMKARKATKTSTIAFHKKGYTVSVVAKILRHVDQSITGACENDLISLAGSMPENPFIDNYI